jgi:hypothetical protein
MRPVAFDVKDNGCGSALAEHFRPHKTFTSSLFQSTYLQGRIVKLSTCNNIKALYDIQWEKHDMGDTAIELGVFFPAWNWHRKIKSKKREINGTGSSKELLSQDLQRVLLRLTVWMKKMFRPTQNLTQTQTQKTT